MMGLSTTLVAYFLFFISVCVCVEQIRVNPRNPQEGQTESDKLKSFKKGGYDFKVDQTLLSYNQKNSEKVSRKVHAIEDRKDCVGITITETHEYVVLQCPNQSKTGCFEVFSRNVRRLQRRALKAGEVCAVDGDKGSIILGTPGKWKIELSSKP